MSVVQPCAAAFRPQTTRFYFRHVALVEIQGKEFQLKPLPLRTVRPFVLEDVTLSEAFEEEGFDINDQIAVSKFLKSRVNQVYPSEGCSF